MNKEEMICKNCKYHYIEEISFDYPQSCCNKRKAVIEKWFNCNNFEYSDRYINQLQQENKILKENAENNDKVVDKINWDNQLLKKENKKLKDNWNKLKECIKDSLEAIDTIQKLTGNAIENYTPRILTYNQIKNKMQELEKGSDSNVKD